MKYTLSLLWGLLGSGLVWAQTERLVVNFGVYEYPPLYHTSMAGEFSGTLGETIKQLCVDAELDCQTQMMPIAKAYAQVIANRSDMTLSGVHPRFDECCLRSQWSYPWSAGFLTLNSRSDLPMSAEKFDGERVIVVRGWRSQYRYLPEFDQLVSEGKIQVIYANSNYNAIQLLERGRGDLLWGSVDFEWYLQRMNLADKITYQQKLEIPIVLWVNKQNPELIKRLDQAYEQLLEQEQLDAHNLLKPEIMQERYLEADFKKWQ